MENFQTTIKKIVEYIGFNEPSVSFDEAGRKVIVFANEGEWIKSWLPHLVSELERICNLIAKKQGLESVFVDFNNYRKEREALIVELAKAAARKVATTKQEVELPVMNAYERRLGHMELASRPDVKTESIGERGERRVVIKLV